MAGHCSLEPETDDSLAAEIELENAIAAAG
jgi:hypothetical protein